jgi:hypothetical protein
MLPPPIEGPLAATESSIETGCLSSASIAVTQLRSNIEGMFASMQPPAPPATSIPGQTLFAGGENSAPVSPYIENKQPGDDVCINGLDDAPGVTVEDGTIVRDGAALEEPYLRQIVVSVTRNGETVDFREVTAIIGSVTPG